MMAWISVLSIAWILTEKYTGCPSQSLIIPPIAPDPALNEPSNLSCPSFGLVQVSHAPLRIGGFFYRMCALGLPDFPQAKSKDSEDSIAGLRSSVFPSHPIDPQTVKVTLLALLVILFLKKLFKSKNGPSKPHPPGWPVVGNIFDLGKIPHHTFYKLRADYGPVIWLKLGAINTMVVQSAEAASELFKKYDLSFADRKVPDSMTSLGYNRGSVAIGAYGDYWRKLRRICSTEFLTHKRIIESTHVRQKCVDKMIEWIKTDVEKSKGNGGTGEIQLDYFLFVVAFNTVGNLTLSRDVTGTITKLDKMSDFFEAFLMFLELIGKPNVADFFPLLKWMDPQGIKKNTTKYLEKLIRFSSEIVKERIAEKESGMVIRERDDFLDALLDEGEVYDDGPDKLSLKNIAILLLNNKHHNRMGNELVRHPKSMKKIQDEIDQVIGRTRKVEETDLTQLPYLQAVVKEILRLHPAAPLLVPRNSMEDTKYMGYFVPKNTQIFVNAWAIHRNPTLWPDPMSFKPERFLDSDIDFNGQDYQMIPFGSGRRSCLGLTLVHRMVSLTIASLLQTFDWKLGDGTKAEELDMREMTGFTLRKKVPLKVIPCLRE
ncbi:hypothetical protein CASFOL_013469 [Castilleja foliolosa]|uniref:Cytochrome P450 n=1 Tax=Castilleja foliolosa TaxID=1961234 RepID=A0ABD3DNZ2_9LAMI